MECLAALEKNIHHVKTLDDTATTPPDHLSWILPRLRTFNCRPTIYHNQDTYHQALKLIGLHPQLHSLILCVWELAEPLASDLAQAFETHPGLKKFKIFGRSRSLTFAQDGMFACRHLETLVWGLGFRGMPRSPHVIELAKEERADEG